MRVSDQTLEGVDPLGAEWLEKLGRNRGLVLMDLLQIQSDESK